MNHLLKTEIDNIKQNNIFSFPLAEVRNSFVSTNDMGEIASKCIIEGPKVHGNKSFEITGATSQNGHEIAEDLGKAMGKKLK